MEAVARHAYLGDTDDVGGGGAWLLEGSCTPLPLLPVTDLVLLPGQVLPLKLLHPGQKRCAAPAPVMLLPLPPPPLLLPLPWQGAAAGGLQLSCLAAVCSWLQPLLPTARRTWPGGAATCPGTAAPASRWCAAAGWSCAPWAPRRQRKGCWR